MVLYVRTIESEKAALERDNKRLLEAAIHPIGCAEEIARVQASAEKAEEAVRQITQSDIEQTLALKKAEADLAALAEYRLSNDGRSLPIQKCEETFKIAKRAAGRESGVKVRGGEADAQPSQELRATATAKPAARK